jgi:bifunctional DNA-binding transcriptional regulator/antitoxin component of YhaV-PrlF toxin-antitoxin module
MLKTELPFLTKISKASSKSDSIRTTIPKEIADSLGLEIHDVLIWQMNGEKITMKKWDGK